MATIKRIEDIEAWQSAEQLNDAFLKVSRECPTFTRASLRDQMQRAAESAMANISEGFDAGYDPEFIRFLKIAKRSTTEFQSHLHAAKASKQIPRSTFDALYELARQTKALIGGFIRYLESCVKAKGRKPRPGPKRRPSGRGASFGRRQRSGRRPTDRGPGTIDGPGTEDR